MGTPRVGLEPTTQWLIVFQDLNPNLSKYDYATYKQRLTAICSTYWANEEYINGIVTLVLTLPEPSIKRVDDSLHLILYQNTIIIWRVLFLLSYPAGLCPSEWDLNPQQPAWSIKNIAVCVFPKIKKPNKTLV